ncbi:MAG: RHS repeat-associated core domain-containing protein, partial [Cytophagaceae bacterium]
MSSYVYDGNGNRTSGKTWGTTFTATVDDQDRLATYNTRTYSYNANEDITSINWGGSAGTSTFAYDVMGNLTQSVGTAGAVYAFQYDTQNRRVNKYEDAAFKYRYIYEPGKSIAANLVSGVIQREYVYATSNHVPDYINAVVGTIAKCRIIKDHLGSPRLIVNSTTGSVVQRLDYNDLGSVTADTSAGYQPFGYAGGIYDAALKIVKFGARDYDPRSGRWMTKDPSLFAGGINLYGYSFNDPINFVDGDGKNSVAIAIVGAGLAVGAI